MKFNCSTFNIALRPARRIIINFPQVLFCYMICLQNCRVTINTFREKIMEIFQIMNGRLTIYLLVSFHETVTLVLP